MTFTVGYGPQWGREFPNYQADQKRQIALFVQTFQAYGLDQTQHQGRISPSWMNVPKTDSRYAYTTTNWLWHYHLGLPQYTKAMGGDVSDELLHFQWVYKSQHVDLIEVSRHYVMGKFYLPPTSSLPTSTPAPAGP